MTENAVEIRGLRVRRRETLVLDGMDLEVRRGVVTGLLGPSGSGKSTLMRAIVGVQQTEAGDVRVFGHAAGSAPARGMVGYTTQAVSIYDDITVDENLDYFRAITGTDHREVDRVLEVVGLRGQRSALGRNLSGGQRARVSLAAALLGSPPLLVLDEPTVGLDPVLRLQLWDAFHAIAESGATLIVSSHVMDEAERCDELILIREGAILANEPPRDLVTRTDTTNVEAAFLKLIGDGTAP